jgi:hypothetical protein
MNYNVPAGFAGDIYLARQNADATWTPLASTLNDDGTISAMVSQDGTFAVVPEPVSLCLLAASGLALLRRRRPSI